MMLEDLLDRKEKEMYKCTECSYTVRTPPVPRTCPQCGQNMDMKPIRVKLEDLMVKKGGAGG